MKIKKNIAISDSGFLFNPLTGESYSINPIGVEIFNLVKDDKSYEEIKTEILDKYQVDETTFEKDYTDFTGFLEHYQLTEEENED